MMRKFVMISLLILFTLYMFSESPEFLSEYEKNVMEISIGGITLDYPLSWFEKFDPSIFERIFTARILQIIDPCKYTVELELGNKVEMVENLELIGLKCEKQFDIDELNMILSKGREVYITYDPISRDGKVYMWMKDIGRLILVNALLMMNDYAVFDEDQDFLYRPKFDRLWDLLEIKKIGK